MTGGVKAENTQVWDHTLEDKRESIMTELGQSVLDILAPQPKERILDIGCGHRYLAKKIADTGCDLTVVTYNRKILAGAKELGLKGDLMKIDSLTYENEFDAVFTNATLHIIKHINRVVAGVAQALKKGGRFVGECAARGHVMTIITAAQKVMAKRGIDMTSLPHWYFPSLEEFQSYLEKSGFQVKMIRVQAGKMALPCTIEEWLWMFAGNLPKALDTADRESFFEEVTEFCRPDLYNEKEGKWVIDKARLQFEAVRL